MKSQLQIYSFYRFKIVCNKKKLKIDLSYFLNNKNIKGTILIADEGINGSISGNSKELEKLLSFVRKKLRIRKLSLKKNNTTMTFTEISVHTGEIIRKYKGSVN